MIDTQCAAILQKHVRLTGRSLLQYIDESFPWTRSRDQAVVHKLKEMLQREQKSAGAITRHLYKNQCGTPFMGQFPVHFTTLNFLSVGRLLQLLVEYQQDDVDELEKDLDHVQEATSKALLVKLLEVKRENLAEFVELSNPPSAAHEENITPAGEAASA